MEMHLVWLLLCGGLVFFMQAGFTCYEAGFVQSKNVIAVTIENLLTFTISVIAFCLIGFPLMYGQSVGGFIGSSMWTFIFDADNTGYDYVFLFVQMMFAAVSVTIFAGAVSERTRIFPLLIVSFISTTLIYPVYGHWVWGDSLFDQNVWLSNLGFMDYAGASVVHTTAGFISLAGLLVIGSRQKINTGKSNIPLAALGIFILWFGWLGFNGTNCDGIENVGLIYINTMLSATFGMSGAIAANFMLREGGGYMISIFNGVLAGLVSITAMSEYCRPWGAIVSGLAAGVCSEFAMRFLRNKGIDDVVSVIPTHLTGGLIGLIVLPFVCTEEYMKCDTVWQQLLVQLIGIAVNFAWVFGISYIMFRVIKIFTNLRVSPEEEKKGLNIVEFNDIYAWEKYIEISSYESEIKEKNSLLRKQARLLAITEEEEKNSLARNLHDGVGQSLAALKIILRLNKKKAEAAGDNGLIQASEKAAELADTSITEMRNVLNDLRPQHLQEGLESGIRHMTENLNSIEGFECSLNIIDEIPAFDETYTLNIYRMIQEALTNVVKHAQSSQAAVMCSRPEKGIYRFEIRDWGKGFNVEEAKRGVGIVSMTDRLRMLGGNIDIFSKEGNGTTVVMEVPLNYE